MNYPQNIIDHAKALGITPQQYLQIAEFSGGTPGFQGNIEGGGTMINNSDTAQFEAVARTLQQAKTLQNIVGGGSTPTTAAPPPPSNLLTNPNQPLTDLGAAALQDKAVYNPYPQQASTKSGVGNVTLPTSSTGIPNRPTGPWDYTPGLWYQQHVTPPSPTGQIQPTGQVTGAPTASAQTFGSASTSDIQAEIQKQLQSGNAWAGNPLTSGWLPTSGSEIPGGGTSTEPSWMSMIRGGIQDRFNRENAAAGSSGLVTPTRFTAPGTMGANYNTANVNQATPAGQSIASSMGMTDTGQRVGAGAAGEQKTMNAGQLSAISSGIGAIGSAIQQGFDQRTQAAQNAAANIANMKSGIPGPDEFADQAYRNQLALQLRRANVV